MEANYGRIESSCGKGRRGCCIIELPNDERPDDVVAGAGDGGGSVQRLFGFFVGGQSYWAVLPPMDSTATTEHSQTPR